MEALYMTKTETPGESTHETVSAAIKQLPEKLHMPKFIGTMTNLILIVLILVGCAGFGLYKMDQKVNTVISSNKVIQEFALKSSQQTILLKLIDEKLGTKATIKAKVLLTQTIVSLADLKKLDISLICGLIDVESGWNPEAISDANAKGLMQVLPSTARSYLRTERVDYKDNVLFDPVINVIVGISYLADLHAAHMEAGYEKEDSYDLSLHSYYWGQSNTAMLYGKKDTRVNTPNMSYPLRVMERAKFYKEKGL
jgi:Transglycosylase SLT domain